MKLLRLSILFASMMLCTVSYAQSANWMTNLPDDTPVRELSIPGAHDAATGNGFSSLSAMAAMFSGVTQSLDLSKQWDAGVRAFDLRPAYKESADGHLQIYHGVLETKLSMKAALQILADKLTSNPGETAIILMRHESDSDSGSASWGSAVADLFGEFDGYIAQFSPGMTLGDARGKMIVLSRDNFSSSKAGMIAGWSHSENFDDQKRASISLGNSRAELYTQDFYECQTEDRKFTAVTAMLDYSTAHTSATPWVINHTSGYIGSSGTNSNILNLAKNINGKVADYLDGAPAGRTGIIFMDFAGVASYNGSTIDGNKLVDKIIAQNAKYIKEPESGVSPLISDDTLEDDAVYDLQGRYIGAGAKVISTLAPGIYIHRGRKVLIK